MRNIMFLTSFVFTSVMSCCQSEIMSKIKIIPLHPYSSSSSRQSIIVDAKMTEYQLSNKGVRAFDNAHWFEVKAISRNVSLSTSNYQIQYEMDALAYYHKDAVKAGVASYSVVTTANAAIGNSVYEYGNAKGLFVRHFRPQYKIINTGVRVRFGWEQSNRIKGVPIRLLTKYTYGLPVNMSF